MSDSFLLRSVDIRETVVHLRCRTPALVATLAENGDTTRESFRRADAARGDRGKLLVDVVDVDDDDSDFNNFSTSDVLANNSS